jgi:RNA 2',3'-cyclic 3'-phosphodiesterase
VLERWQETELCSVPELRVVGRQSLHVTLCFLGTRPEAEVEAIGAACAGVAGRAVAGLALGSVLWLPSARRPSVLAVGIADPEGGLAALQATVARSLVALGCYAVERRAYLPHVTVARVRRGGALGGGALGGGGGGEERCWRGFGGSAATTSPADPFDGVAVTLFRSRLRAGPARYERLRSVPLGGRSIQSRHESVLFGDSQRP